MVKRFIPKKIDPQPGKIIWAEVHYTDGRGSKFRPVLLVRRRSDEEFDAFYFTSNHHHDEIKVEVTSADIQGLALDVDPSYLVLSEKVIVKINTFKNELGFLKDEKKKEVKASINQIRQRLGIQVSQREKEQEFSDSEKNSRVLKPFERPPKPKK